jgi:hypothetical protein
MARGRMISKTLGSSRRFQAVAEKAPTPEMGAFCQVLFVLIVSHADDFGRLEGDAFTIKHRVFPVSPHSESEFASALKVLHASELILWYSVQGKHIVEVSNFSEHQSGLHKKTTSRFPDPPRQKRSSGRRKQQTPSVGGDTVTVRAREMVESYKVQYQAERHKPYLQHRVQEEKDLDAATQLVMAYQDDDIARIVTQYLRLPNDHSKLKFLKGGQRTIPTLLTQAGEIAETLDIQGVVA